MKCRHCRTPLDDAARRLRRPRRRAAVERLPARRGPVAPGAALSAQGDDLPGVQIWSRSTRCSVTTRCSRATMSTSRRSRARGWRMPSATSTQACARLGLGRDSLVMEVASNDGYLLQYVAARGIPCVGIEPTAGTAEAAQRQGHRDDRRVLRRRLRPPLRRRAAPGRPDPRQQRPGPRARHRRLRRVASREALAPAGSITIEFPHLLQLVQEAQFDTIYHEHFSYLSLRTVQRIFAAQGLAVWDVETLPTHGGSLRVWAQHAANPRPVEPRGRGDAGRGRRRRHARPRLLPGPAGARRRDQARRCSAS